MRKIFVVGDSISIHYGPYLERGLRGVMAYDRKGGQAEASRNPDPPADANGGDSAMVLAYLRRLKDGGGPDADTLLLNCGLHDIKRDPVSGACQVPIDAYARNLAAILDVAGEMGLDVVWVRTTPCDERVHNRPGMKFHRYAADCRAYNLRADEIMRARGVPVVDLHTFTLNQGDDLFCDHVHFREPVRMSQGAFLAGWLIGRAAGARG
jgi:hypothetical protein